MKITRSRLERIIKEETQRVLSRGPLDSLRNEGDLQMVLSAIEAYSNTPESINHSSIAAFEGSDALGDLRNYYVNTLGSKIEEERDIEESIWILDSLSKDVEVQKQIKLFHR